MPETPRLRQQIPPLTLRSLSGKTVSAWDFKQKRNRVIALLRADSTNAREFVRELAEHVAAWKEKEAVALIVFSELPPMDFTGTLPPEIVIGTDASGRSFEQYLGADASKPGGLQRQGVFIADRYGELFARWVMAKNDAMPSIAAILTALEQIEIACEECQVPEWPAEG